VIIIELPIPPSLNNAYPTNKRTGKRYPSPKLTAWKTGAGWEIKAAKLDRITGPYNLDIQVCANLRGDLDNRIKAIADLLVEHQITPDDAKAQRVTIWRSVGQVARGRCIVCAEAA
jgi:Holliday junction resolvase RusA-like endonuclease